MIKSLSSCLSCLNLLLVLLLCSSLSFAQTPAYQPKEVYEYLWYEAENMRGITMNARFEPVLNPSYLNLSKEKAAGWGINGPGVSAEWTQGGESEWNSAAASADETRGTIYQEMEVPRDGAYRVWVRYADWAGRSENFTVRITQGGVEVFRQEFGARDLVEPHDEVSMYWGWAFTWDKATAQLKKGAARLSIEIEKSAGARRHVDCALVTNDPAFVPEGRMKPPFAAMTALESYSRSGRRLAPLLEPDESAAIPKEWKQPLIAGRDFLMPWNIAPEFWTLYDKPPAERPLYPFNAEPIDQFMATYKGAKDVPIFGSKLVVPVIYINDLPQLMKEGSPFLRYLRETRQPFAILINYGAPEMPEALAQSIWKLLSVEFREQFLGWISGESIGHVWGDASASLKLQPTMSRRELLEAHRVAYTGALAGKWRSIFKTETGAQWDKLIAAQSTSSTSFAHALGEWGERIIGLETAAVQPGFAMRFAFTRGAARQFNASTFYYHAPNFGDTATVFTQKMSYAGPDNFFHTRYGATMGPSLSWYRKSYYHYYMAGASAIYLEQGGDQFFKPGPGEHPFQLNPLGRITDEFMRFVERHPYRGTPYTPVAFLLDPAHGWEMTDYPHWPFGVSQLNRSDRALRELFGAAYYPMPVVEGEPATGDRQAFINAVFGDIFDVLVASDKRADAIDAYRAVVVGGHIEWSRAWAQKLSDYVRRGGVVVLNTEQLKGLPASLTGVGIRSDSGEASEARCLIGGEENSSLRGQVFRYHRIAKDSNVKVLMETLDGDPLVTVNKVGRGRVILVTVPDMLGLDERLTPFAAHLLAHLFTDATPVEVRGDVEHLVNRTERGWLVTLINNQGVYKPQQGMARVDRRAVVEVSISLRGTRQITSAAEWTEDKKLATAQENGRDTIRLSLPPGAVQIVELIERK
ncbi:MAG: hypothetical protein ICV60_21800 [Pyrinomonadaceae bacterium]|nr:hypothetical protein [Pyrinomonadaceae bacterium]